MVTRQNEGGGGVARQRGSPRRRRLQHPREPRPAPLRFELMPSKIQSLDSSGETTSDPLHPNDQQASPALRLSTAADQLMDFEWASRGTEGGRPGWRKGAGPTVRSWGRRGPWGTAQSTPGSPALHPERKRGSPASCNANSYLFPHFLLARLRGASEQHLRRLSRLCQRPSPRYPSSAAQTPARTCGIQQKSDMKMY